MGKFLAVVGIVAAIGLVLAGQLGWAFMALIVFIVGCGMQSAENSIGKDAIQASRDRAAAHRAAAQREDMGPWRAEEMERERHG